MYSKYISVIARKLSEEYCIFSHLLLNKFSTYLVSLTSSVGKNAWTTMIHFKKRVMGSNPASIFYFILKIDIIFV